MWKLWKNISDVLSIYPHLIWAPDPELYDCSNRSIEEWYLRGTARPIQGWISLIFGLLILFLYSLTLIAMTNRDFLKHSCYQMMYYASINDCLNVITSNIVSGYYLIVGATFCTHPISNYFWGAMASGGWCGMCVAVMNLGFGRLSEVTGRGKWLFDGKMVLFWIFMSFFVWFLVAFMTHNAVFNSTIGAFFFAPFVSDDIIAEITTFRNVILPFFEIFTANTILATYLFIFFYLSCSKQAMVGERKFSKFQRNLLLQCTLICSVLAITCYLYTYLLTYESPPWLALVAQIFYQLSECTPLASYFIFNLNIRTRVLSMLGIKKHSGVNATKPITAVTDTNMQSVPYSEI